MARRAGLTPYTDDDCVLYASGPLVVVHATCDGTIRLNRPKNLGDVPLRNVLTGAVQGTGPVVELDLHLGDTRILRW